MYRINAEGVGDRQQHRGQDQNQRRHVHQRTNQQQHDVNTHQNDILVIRDTGKRFGNAHRQLHIGHDGAKRCRETDQDHHDSHGLHSAIHQFRQFRPLIVAVDKHGDEKRPQAGDRRRFRRGKNTGKDPAHNDDDRHQPPQRIEKDLQCLSERHALPFRVAALMRKAHAHYHQGKTQQ